MKLFAENVETIKSVVLSKESLPEQVRLSLPKIYKGENYLQLPYVIMDYPRCFNKEDIFAVRTMFWWGNFFSITLQLSGMYKNLVKDHIYSAGQPTAMDLFIGVNENQWQHHFEEDNFIQVARLSQQQRVALFEKNDFIKLAIKFSLDKWNEMPSLLNEAYKRMAGILFNYPAGEKDL